MTEIETKNKKIARQVFEAIDVGDLERFKALVPAETVVDFAGFPDPIPRDTIAQKIREHYTAFPDHTHHFKEIIAEGDTVALWITQQGTHQGEYEGIAPTGKTITIESMFLLKIREGQVREFRVIEDILSQMQQLGMELQPRE